MTHALGELIYALLNILGIVMVVCFVLGFIMTVLTMLGMR